MPKPVSPNVLTLFALALSACATHEPVVEMNGECSDVYQAHVCTWTKMQGKNVIEVGVMLPVAAIENAPAQDQMAWPPVPVASLQLPDSSQQRSGLMHFTMLWEAMGHPPAPFMTPHFDFHFYVIPSGERTGIDCSDTSKPAALATGYTLPDMTLPPPMAKMIGVTTLVGICVPQMGMHSLLATELESQPPFRGTMVIGYYHGKPIFIEPMLSRAMLLEKRSFDLPIPLIPGLAGDYPRAFHAEYDTAKNAYRFAFSDFRSGV